jgi:NADH dehydrogenase
MAAIKTVTVFGGSGFLGRHFIRRLAKTGAIIRVAVRHPNAAGHLRPMGDVGQITALRCDIGRDRDVADAVAGADAVVNLVGILYQSGKQRFHAIQAEAPGRIARAASASGAGHLVQVSAIGAVADAGSLYARTKAAGEEAVRAAFADAVILRPSILFGPEDDFFNRFATLARMLPVLPLIGGGHTKMQPAYVGDVADALMAALAQPQARGRTYELGGPRVYDLRQIMELVMQMTGRHRPLVSVPFAIASLKAAFLELLPVPPLTRDQVTLLKSDNVVSPGASGFAEFGIVPAAAEAILPTYLDRFREGGRFAAAHRAS